MTREKMLEVMNQIQELRSSFFFTEDVSKKFMKYLEAAQEELEAEFNGFSDAESFKLAYSEEREADQEAHSQVTLEMEEGRSDFASLVPLTEWAKENNIKPDTARKLANLGKLKSAKRVGRDWMILENEIYILQRKHK